MTTKGSQYLLTDREESQITLTGDLYLCLNGKKITEVRFVGGGYTVYITLCEEEEESKVVVNQANYLINNGYAQILGGTSSINVEVDKIMSADQSIDREGSYVFYNTIMRPIREGTDYLINSQIARDIVISNVSIANYSLAEGKRLINIALTGDNRETVKIIKTKVENVKTTNQTIFYFNRGAVLYKDNEVENVETGHSIVWATEYGGRKHL